MPPNLRFPNLLSEDRGVSDRIDGVKIVVKDKIRLFFCLPVLIFVACGAAVTAPSSQNIPVTDVDQHVFNAVANGVGRIWNTNIISQPLGQISVSGACPLGGAFSAVGADSNPSTSTDKMNVNFQLTACKISDTLSGTSNGAPFTRLTILTLDGVVNFNGSITADSSGNTAQNITYSAAGLKIVGVDSATGYADSQINETCDYSASYVTTATGGSVSGTMCGRPVTVPL